MHHRVLMPLVLFLVLSVSCGDSVRTEVNCLHCTREIQFSHSKGIHPCPRCDKDLLAATCPKCRKGYIFKVEENGMAVFSCDQCRVDSEAWQKCRHCSYVQKAEGLKFVKACRKCYKWPYGEVTCPNDKSVLVLPKEDAYLRCKKCPHAQYASYCPNCNKLHLSPTPGDYQCSGCKEDAVIRAPMTGADCGHCNEHVSVPDVMGEVPCRKCKKWMAQVKCRDCGKKQFRPSVGEFSCFYCKKKQSIAQCPHCRSVESMFAFDGAKVCTTCKEKYHAFSCTYCYKGQSIPKYQQRVNCRYCKKSVNVPR